MTATRPAGDIVLDGISVARGGRTILAGVSAVLPAGRVTAVTGPSGSGKSTLLAVVAGFEPPDAGVLVNPFPPGHRGVVLQSYGLVPLLTAAENVEMALQSAGLPPSEVVERAAAQLERFGLAALADRQTDELSGGQQQRLAIARALAVEPDLLIADELTSELDPRNRDLVLDTVFALRDAGTTVVLATHDPRVAEACDVVVAVAAQAEPMAEERAREAAADAAEREQRRRIRAQQELVRREQARLDEMRQALDRLLAERGRRS